MNAWLLTWEGTKGPALSQDCKIVAILSGRMSDPSVEIIVDALYTRCVWTAGNVVNFANKRKAREKQFRHIYSQPSRFFYGTNPCIFARLVRDLVVNTDEDQQLEHVCWTEPPLLREEEPGDKPTEVELAITKQLSRVLEPIVAEIYSRTPNKPLD